MHYLRNLFRLRPLNEAFVRHSEVKRSYSMPAVIIIVFMMCIPFTLFAILPKTLTSLAGPSTVLALLLGFILSYSTGLHLGELCCAVPKNNVLYQVAFASIGELPAFIIGWISLLQQLCLIHLTTRCLSQHATLIFRTELKSKPITWDSKLLEPEYDFIAMTMVILVTMLANCGSRVIVCLAACLISLTMLILSSCTMVTFFHINPNNWIQANFFTYGAEGFFRGVCAACVCFAGGTDSISLFLEESKIPRRRTTPLISSLNVLLFLIFFTVFLLFSISLNVSNLAASTLLPEFFTRLNVPAANEIDEPGFYLMRYMLSVGSVCSLFGALLCLMVPGSRALLTMSIDGLIPLPSSPRLNLFFYMLIAVLSIFIRSSIIFSLLLFLAPLRCIIIICLTFIQHYCSEPVGIPHETSHYKSMMASNCDVHGSLASVDSESSALFIANAARIAEDKLQKKLEEAMNGSLEQRPVIAKSVSQYHTMDCRQPNSSSLHEHNCMAESCNNRHFDDDDSAHLFNNEPIRICTSSLASSIGPQPANIPSERQRAACQLTLFILSTYLLSQLIFSPMGVKSSSSIVLMGLFLLLMLIATMLISRLTPNDYRYRRHNSIKFFPYNSLFSLGFLILSIGSLETQFLFSLFAWMCSGLFIYLIYGYFHSSQRHSKKSILRDQNDDLLDSEQYAPIIDEESSQL